jgi:molybdenum cofactor cytidylyltransferase
VLSAAECACQSQAVACAVVIGAHGQAVRAALGELSIDVLDNTGWDEGVASSIRIAAAWARQRNCQALLLALCDQPELSALHLDHLIAAHEASHLTVASRYAGKNAVPALFPEARFDELGALRGDAGASALLNDGSPVVSVYWPDGEWDVDTPEAERRLQGNRDERGTRE